LWDQVLVDLPYDGFDVGHTATSFLSILAQQGEMVYWQMKR